MLEQTCFSMTELLRQTRRILSKNRIQTGSGAHPASYPVDNVGSLAGSKEAESWSWPLTSI
jgi:hypothetical protein